jgi:hypothetical protein
MLLVSGHLGIRPEGFDVREHGGELAFRQDPAAEDNGVDFARSIIQGHI